MLSEVKPHDRAVTGLGHLAPRSAWFVGNVALANCQPIASRRRSGQTRRSVRLGEGPKGTAADGGGQMSASPDQSPRDTSRLPAGAIRLALGIANGIMRDHGAPAVRVGLHYGPALGRDGDYFGAAVNLAARVSGQAVGGERLVRSP